MNKLTIEQQVQALNDSINKLNELSGKKFRIEFPKLDILIIVAKREMNHSSMIDQIENKSKIFNFGAKIIY